MGRPTNRLTAIAAQQASKRRGSVCDGGGLWLISKPPNSAYWTFRYKMHGRDRWMGLGPYPDLPLADARARAAQHRHSLALDIDPIEERRRSRDEIKLEIARRQTFRQCADQYIVAHAGRWKHAKTGEQWRNSLARLVYPLIGALPVAAIDDGLVIKVLQPIWNKTPETASRVRSRIEAVLSWATVMKARPPEPNPARWKGHLDQVLPAIETLAPVKHFAAMPYGELPGFMTALRGKPDVAARALEFAILTAARTGEVNAVQAAERGLAALHAGTEKAAAKLNALEKTRGAITLDAVESGISGPLDKLDVAVASAKLDLARSETALQSAQERLAEVTRKHHLATHDQTIKLAQKLMKQRMKYANILAEHVAGVADAYQRLLDASERIQVAIPWPRGIVPMDGQLYAPAINALLSRELMRVRPTNPITASVNPPLPGAFVNPHAGNPTQWKTLVEEFQASCDFLVGVVTEVPR